MGPLAVIDLELAAARSAGDSDRARRLEAARKIVEEFTRLAKADPGVAGMLLDALPRQPVTPTDRG
jgi:hypothetical protein